MGLKLEYLPGQTPISEEEKEGLLIKTITTHAELDEHEQLNIQKALEWTLGKKFDKQRVLSEAFVKELHKKMFSDVWNWAGKFRLSEKNFGVKYHVIGTSLKQLNEDCLFWIEQKTFSEDEIAIRFKHKIVDIHCFANGNGRHSRLMADVIISHVFGKGVFTWGAANIKRGESRTTYLTALRKADKEDPKDLIQFARGKAL